MRGLQIESLRDVYYATIVSRITYCIPAWYGLCSAVDLAKLNKILKRGYKSGYLDDIENKGSGVNNCFIESISQTQVQKYFTSILQNEHHVLHAMLPPYKSTERKLRCRNYDRQLPIIESPHDMHNFIIYMMYQNKK